MEQPETWSAIAKQWGLSTFVCIGFLYLFIKFVLPVLGKTVLEQFKNLYESNEKVIAAITSSSKENIKIIMESNEREAAATRAEYKESLRMQGEIQQKAAEYNLQIHKLYADKIEAVTGKLDGVVSELRDFKDEISQRIEEVTINFQKL